MPATLPTPIEFRLPEGWLPAGPDRPDAEHAAFVAVHPRPDAGFTATIAIDGERLPDGATPAHLADESVERLRELAVTVDVTDRREVGTAEAPALTQRLAFSAVVDGALRDLVQSQVYLFVSDVEDVRKQAVIRLILTASVAQHDTVLRDFQEFVRTVRPDTGAGF
ncbi:hypothetical protein QWJ26_00770 [Streptomyces sp. CSDS2]|uniref:hypothetical protein n=1 Tax=Streptomyces sp. CSDS2 TaxID=3055051 RepID=UPI0025B0B1E5|nr:hypothetical protein [Streptomyces sp. CSDS2]MDN3258365.1 hypothetical protein [Streptomyces sp. CSDS2]